MPLSRVQKGAVGQFEFLVTALVTGKGQVEVYTPAIDNEGRDAEIRRHLKPAPAVGVQIKITFSLRSNGYRAKYLLLRFALPANRVQNDSRLWYLLAAYDGPHLRWHDPLFLVPAKIFHKLARRQLWKGRIRFSFSASMEPGSRDEWSPYRVAPKDLGNRLLEIIDDGSLKAEVGSSPLPAGAIVLGRARRRAARPKRNHIARAA